MKRMILTCSIALAMFGTVRIAEGRIALTQSDRERLETDIRRQLAPLVGVFDNVTFSIEPDRTVTLLGQVREPNLKKHIEEDAARVEGVQSVKSQIEVLPLSPADDELRLRMYRAVYGQEGLQRYSVQVNPPIHIIVKNGAVSLEGIVANKLEYAQVNVAANGVPGAFSVKNNLRVERDS